jgi:hypothetical protein
MGKAEINHPYANFDIPQSAVPHLLGGIHTFMKISQIIATLIDAGSLIAIGIIIPFAIPKFVQKQIEQGKFTPEKGASFKKYGGWFGWFLIAFGVFKLVVGFMPHH